MPAARLLNALADLAPAAKPPTYDHLGAMAVWGTALDAVTGGAELASYDELHRDERLLRQGWGVVMGRIEIDGKPHKVRLPLVSRPVRLTADGRGGRQRIVPAGDTTVHAALAGGEYAPLLEAVFDPEADPATAWLAEAAAAAGFAGAAVTEKAPRDKDPMAVVARPVVYIDRDAAPTPIAAGLRDWAAKPGLEHTAFAAMYDPRTDAAPEADTPPRCALPLSREQTAAVVQSRTQPVTVIAGAPGCGKSHTLAAIALDAVAAGESVLLATQSVHAADVLAALLERHPGPVPVHFGDTERRDRFQLRLGSGTVKGHKAGAVDKHRRAADDATAYTDRVETEIATWLDLEDKRRRARDLPDFLLNDFPGLRDADLDEVERHLRLAEREDGGWWARLRARRSTRRLARLAGADGNPVALRRAVEAARDQRGMALLASNGGLHLESLWRALEQADTDAAAAVGTALRYEAESDERRSGRSRRALAGLATGLRAARTGRRALLAGLDADALLKAMPLWVGTVGDVEDLLPAVPGMFDLVILDEASHINQLRAAPALARARRAVVAGDPRQLRFVSFASEDRLTEVLGRHGLTDRAPQLDTGRVSAYDLATGAGPVVELTEHHRSVPHLIGFSAARFYDGRVKPVTTHPRNHEADAIHLHRVEAAASGKGVVKSEVDASLELLAERVEAGDRGIAVITPFRAQAEAIEAGIVRRFDLDAIRRHGIRAGTVHAFQGSEADTVIAALGVAAADPAGRRRFAAGANLFNVMITRARHRLHVVTAIGDADGLIGAFLTYADSPPRSPERARHPDAWTRETADALAHSGVKVRTAYPVGHWSVDLVVGDGEDALGVITAVHPEGPAAHLARHRALRRAGWRLADAFPSTYGDDPSRAAVALLTDFKAGSAR
ncbi:AAA domain-containing protein [Glycomyces harbinensis]|uniref:AAA domain-containing protein n=1 Tax=Glycomyces harbinensis TaxID=58114 RepID=A0A1G7BFR8_9ACTN|nr:AAA domain-containing protein [Glycomyces harbinensis]SDE25823.1 AAA domain-containing protein [Glycomyces harbinensis]